MTVKEFKNEFDIQYNAVVGASNPGLDDYEISVYLTRAQLEIVKGIYDETSNIRQRGFEGSEKRRTDLKELLADYKTTLKSKSQHTLDDKSVIVNLPKDVLFIVNENLKANVKGCAVNATVLPITHDEYNLQRDNPFKKPNKYRAWRIDYSSLEGNPVVEILYPTDNFEYRLRYLKYPKPIIISDLEVNYPNENLSIDNITSISECQLNIELHPQILNRAIELAKVDYNDSGLENKIQLDQRQE